MSQFPVTNPLVITLDGPAGSGKTVCGRRAALALGLPFISSGLYFRAATFVALEAGISLRDEDGLTQVAHELALTFVNEEAELRVLVAGEDCTRSLKDPRVTTQIRFVAENPGVRDALSRTMRSQAEQGPLLAEGRDMGSVVFPEAPLKFFLEAGLACRVDRRLAELRAMGKDVDRAQLSQEIAARDERDRTRSISPLVIPQGAVVIDTSALRIGEVVTRIVETVRAHGPIC